MEVSEKIYKKKAPAEDYKRGLSTNQTRIRRGSVLGPVEREN